MTSFLRTASTRRLLAMIAAAIAAIAAGTAIAVAASGSGPVPPHKSLASAIRGALGGAPAVEGVTARISFTNHLIDASSFQGSDPLVQGATGRLWLTGNRLRLELQSDNGDAQVVVNRRSFWIYDPTSNTAYEGTLPKQGRDSDRGARHPALPSLASIQRELGLLARHLDLSAAIPGDIAGRPAYTVRVSPRHDGGLLGAVELGWDAMRGVPLRFAVYARGQSSPVLELKATDISYGRVPVSDFAISPPSGAKVVSLGNIGSRTGSSAHRGESKQREVTGVAAVARHLSFKLVAPRSLVGLSRRSVTLLNWQGAPAALVTYGRNLGGIAVIEQAGAASASQGSAQGGDHPGLSLPTVSIDGATGQELDTALGTMVRFSRGGVSYTVIGSVPPSAAELAARAL